MNNHQDKIAQLNARLDALLKRQEYFSKEIFDLKEDILKLSNKDAEIEKPQADFIQPIKEEILEDESPIVHTEFQKEVIEPPKKEEWNIPNKQAKKPKSKSDLEKFIGENLINKIGIIITVIGVSLGAKYSIEHDLISPLTRIILGYLSGFGLLVIGLKLKKKYINYSAVLVSGAMAIMYFITFSAYSFYELIPQLLAFILMFIFTGFTVIAALNYNKQIIAHIGLVGAYAVPFLLSNDSGNVLVLYSYMAIINLGILIISFKKYWKPLYYVSFALTWIIFISWFVFDYDIESHYIIALSFASLFFIIFYGTFLAYKLVKKEKFSPQDILLLLANSFIYYGLGYAILSEHEIGKQLLGLFTLANALVHFAVSITIFKQKLADKVLFYLISGLVLVFITLAIPVQLDGNWVTILWAFEAAILFWVGRTKNVKTYELISYILMFLALFSILHDWANTYDYFDKKIAPFINIHFLSSLLFIAAFAFITYLSRNNNYKSPLNEKWLVAIFSFIIPFILIFSIYSSIRLEIAEYMNQLYHGSAIELNNDRDYFINQHKDIDLRKFKTIWILNYTLFFVSILSIVNYKKIKNEIFGYIIFGVSILAILTFLTQGLYELSELRENYLSPDRSEYFKSGFFNIAIRYISFLFLALILFINYKFITLKIKNIVLKRMFYLALHIAFIWIVSSELIHWMDMQSSEQSYKLGLSILWGVYSLSLIIYGIWKNKQYLRVGAIVLFGVTLIKLFFYDISHLNTISKTIVFVSLGVLLLIISFLYNKYKNKITDEVENKE